MLVQRGQVISTGALVQLINLSHERQIRQLHFFRIFLSPVHISRCTKKFHDSRICVCQSKVYFVKNVAYPILCLLLLWLLLLLPCRVCCHVAVVCYCSTSSSSCSLVLGRSSDFPPKPTDEGGGAPCLRDFRSKQMQRMMVVPRLSVVDSSHTGASPSQTLA